MNYLENISCVNITLDWNKCKRKFTHTTPSYWFQFCRCMLNMFKIILVSVCLQTSGTTLTWFSSLYQTRYGAFRPDWAKAVYRSQSSTFPWCSRLLGFTFHHCYLRLGHAPGKIDRQRAIETKGYRTKGQQLRDWVLDLWWCAITVTWHGHHESVQLKSNKALQLGSED